MLDGAGFFIVLWCGAAILFFFNKFLGISETLGLPLLLRYFFFFCHFMYVK
jgi:hypothetical protein